MKYDNSSFLVYGLWNQPRSRRYYYGNRKPILRIVDWLINSLTVKFEILWHWNKKKIVCHWNKLKRSSPMVKRPVWRNWFKNRFIPFYYFHYRRVIRNPLISFLVSRFFSILFLYMFRTIDIYPENIFGDQKVHMLDIL